MSRKTRLSARAAFLAAAFAALALGACATKPRPAAPAAAKVAKRTAERTVADALAALGPAAEQRLRDRFAAAGVVYPPERVHLLGFKAERQLELWASTRGRPKRVAVYPLLDGSGVAGPKLREGDFQIPEGSYRVIWLHPNSQYHLSMKLDYPNEFDREQARKDGRTNLGGDIFIHGGDASIGCLAVGDPAIEELFLLGARVGIEHFTVILAPWDLRRRSPPDLDDPQLAWLTDLYARLSRSLAAFR